MIKEMIVDKDIECCAEVIREAFKTVADEFGLTKSSAPTNPAFITFDRLKQSIAQGTKLFALLKAEQVIGCIGVEQSQKDEHVFFIERLAVLPKARHRGYGTELLNFACSYIKHLHGKTVSIGIIEENKILKKWYIKHGFKETSVKKYNHLPFTVCFLEKQVI
jgi:ribosomal protein S18 acetylase RimI-like enzyme